MKIQIMLDRVVGSIGEEFGWHYGIHFGNINPRKFVYIKYSEFESNDCEVVRRIQEKFYPIIRRMKIKGYFD